MFALAHLHDGQHGDGSGEAKLLRRGASGRGDVAEPGEERVDGELPSLTAAHSSSVSGMEASMRCKFSLASRSWDLLVPLGV